MQLLSIPLARHCLERIFGGKSLLGFPCLAFGGRVKTRFQPLTLILSFLPSSFERYFRVDTQRQGFFLPD